MTTSIQADDPCLSWLGAVSLEKTGDWVRPWRLPHEQRDLFPPEGLMLPAGMPSGVRLVFRTDARELAGRVVPCTECAPLDLVCDGELLASAPLAGQEEFRFGSLPAGEKLIELWLPQFGEFRLRELSVPEGASLARCEDRRPRWITYGSSITQCRAAESPAHTWPAIVARRRGLNLTNLGFGGQCHLDVMIARLIRDLPADVISLCLGINVYGAASLTERTFRPAVIGFVKIIRDRHARVPLAVISPICAPDRETVPNTVGFTLEAMREEVASAVAALRAHGDGNVHYIDGLELVGPELAHLLPDNVHPSAEGYKVVGERFSEKAMGRLLA